MNKMKTLINTTELKALYDIGNGKLQNNYRLLEAAMIPFGKADYDTGHIPNAVFFDLTKGVQSSKLYPKAIPDKKKFADYISSLGVSNNNHIIVYDRSPFGFLGIFDQKFKNSKL
jgi:3-mercaptopyruvate sulfurtransferase SseA